VAEAGQNTRTSPDTITEVRGYFKGWKPPSGLKQSLEYSVILNPDGTIQQIFPLSNAAAENIEKTNLPSPGTALASPVEGGAKTGIHLVFSLDGKVNASLEEIRRASPDAESSSSPSGDSSSSPSVETTP
jgi:hypothetical protein